MEHTRTLIEKAEAAAARGDHDSARRYLREYEANAPDDPDLYILRGSMALAEGNFRQAREVLEQGLARLPGSVPLLDALGLVCEQEGDVQAALASYRRALAGAGEAERAEIEAAIARLGGAPPPDEPLFRPGALRALVQELFFA